MKNTLLVFALVTLFTTSYQPLTAQLDNGEIAPDWTLTDINGNTHDLYDLLEAGKTVLIDFSATWCGPCWNYHNTHAMADFYNEHGPNGTDEVMVFFIEGDLSTGMDDLMGLTDQSQGDWISGSPYPIIDLDVDNFWVMDGYDVGYFPTIYMICPNAQIYEAGQVGEPILETWISSCTLEADLLSTSGTTCYGFGQGSADITASGGYSGINYDWSNGDNTQDLQDVEAGTYSVTVSEGNGREVIIDNVEIDGPLDPIEVSSYEIADLLCTGDGTGGISIDVEGGNGGFSYSWSNGMSNSTITNLSAGEYWVTIEDAQGCELVEYYEVNQPEVLDFAVDFTIDHCNQGGATITVSPSGGTEPYDLEASDGFVSQGSMEVVGLGAGDVYVELIDANNCTIGLEVTIENIDGPEIIMPAEPTVTCATGPVSITPFLLNPAEGPLEYYWTTSDGEIVEGQFDPTVTVFAPGTYTLHIEDVDYGCDTEESIVVNGSVDLPEIDAGPDLAIDCNNQVVQPDVVTESGGEFLFQWTTSNGHILSGANAPVPQIDAPGTYTVQVTNVNTNCTNTDLVVVTDNRVFPDAAYTFTAEELLAKFSAQQAGATAYHWDFGDGQSSDLQNPEHTYAISGTYHVCLTVSNSCGSDEHCLDIWVQNSTSAILVELSISNISCFGAHDGTLEAIALGGSGNYTFSWLAPGGDVLTGAVQSNLGPGLYLLTVSDDAGNVTQVQVSVYEPTELLVEAKELPPGNISGPGIDLTVDGGTQGYTFLWSNGSTAEDLILLPSGLYQCTVTDANGCSFVTETFRIINPRDLTIQRPQPRVEVYGNPGLQPLVIVVDDETNSDMERDVVVYDALGRPMLNENWIGREHEIDLRTYPSGVYFITVYAQKAILRTIRVTLMD